MRGVHIMKDGEFLFRKSFYESCQEISDPKIRLAAYEAICEYGVTEKNDWEQCVLTDREIDMVKMVLKPIYATIDSTKERYRKAVENGRKGGLMGGRGNKKKPDETTDKETTKKSRTKKATTKTSKKQPKKSLKKTNEILAI